MMDVSGVIRSMLKPLTSAVTDPTAANIVLQVCPKR
jgi:hypothetical protein